MILREDCYPIGAIVKLLKIFSQFIAIVPWQIHLATRTNHCPPKKRGRLRFSFPTTQWQEAGELLPPANP